MDTLDLEFSPEQVRAAVDRVLVTLRGPAPERPSHIPELVKIKLTLDQASLLCEKLDRVFSPRQNAQANAKRQHGHTDPFYLLAVLHRALLRLPQTTPQASRTGKVVRFLAQGITLELRPHEAAYLLRILANKKRDTWRRENQEHRIFAPLEVAEIAEEGDEQGPTTKQFLSPSHHENPDAQIQIAVLKKALGELPEKLKMPPEEISALLTALTNTEGNVSETARQLGQPQRKTARRIERILRHLKSRGLSA